MDPPTLDMVTIQYYSSEVDDISPQKEADLGEADDNQELNSQNYRATPSQDGPEAAQNAAMLGLTVERVKTQNLKASTASENVVPTFVGVNGNPDINAVNMDTKSESNLKADNATNDDEN